MKPSKLFLIAVTIGAITASSAMARPSSGRTNSTGRSFTGSTVRTSAHYRGHNNNNWRHHRHHRHHSRIYFGFGYPFAYGYPYYGSYPYGYGYYARPREAVYYANAADGSIVGAVQQRLARAGYYRGAIDGVMGPGTRSAIRSYERSHRLRVDGVIDRRLLATMGLA